MTKTPQTWGRWRKRHYHEAIRAVTAPVLLLAGEHEALIGFNDASLRADVARLGGPAEHRVFSPA